MLEAGQSLYYPPRWWHATQNLESETIGVAGRVVSRANVAAVFAEIGAPMMIRPCKSERSRSCLLLEVASGSPLVSPAGETMITKITLLGSAHRSFACLANWP